VRESLHFPRHQNRSDTGSLRSFLIRFRKKPTQPEPVLIWAIVLAGLCNARSSCFGGGRLDNGYWGGFHGPEPATGMEKEWREMMDGGVGVIPHDDFTLTKLQCFKRVTHEVTHCYDRVTHEVT
jgi:hypothetical protein